MKVQHLTNNNDLKCQLNLAKQYDTVKFGMSFEYAAWMPSSPCKGGATPRADKIRQGVKSQNFPKKGQK